jgi:hypothetical protein
VEIGYNEGDENLHFNIRPKGETGQAVAEPEPAPAGAD